MLIKAIFYRQGNFTNCDNITIERLNSLDVLVCLPSKTPCIVKENSRLVATHSLRVVLYTDLCLHINKVYLDANTFLR